MSTAIPPVVAWPAGVILAALLGSFLNVCISRLPAGESVVWPRSRCPECRAPIRAWHNLPLVSFLALGGRCRDCRAPISWRYPVVEALTVALGGLVLWQDGPTWAGLRSYALGLGLIVVTFTDLEHRIIPDAVTLPGIVLGLILQLPSLRAVLDGALGCLVAGGIFYLIAVASPHVFGREGMGGGDIKLAAMMGAFLGLRAVLLGVFVGVMVGGVAALVLLLVGLRRWGEYVTFGPFLALGGVVAAFWAEPLLAWYLGLR
jgi:leader peptidase (prepilin peptidase)/N-methyltransferase